MLRWACMLFAMSVGSLAVYGPVGAQSRFRMEGVVVDADAREPVATATVQVLIASERAPEKRLLRAVTNGEGRYSVELPAGHAWSWQLLPPAGYYVVEKNLHEQFATTDDRPIYLKNYQVRRGVPIELVVRRPEAVAALPKAFVTLTQQDGAKFLQGSGELNEQGASTVTLPKLAGKFKVGFWDELSTLEAPDDMAAEFEVGFDPRNVHPEIKRADDGTVSVRDVNGRTATLTKCAAQMRDGRLAIVIDATAARPHETAVTLKGRVVDDKAAGVPGATVKAAFFSQGGSGESPWKATTDGNGDFSLAIPKMVADQKVGLIVTREGFGGVDTQPLSVTRGAERVANVDSIVMKAGCSLRIRVVGPNEAPLHGAVVEPLNGYASRTRIARTGADGECLLTDLAPGLTAVRAQFGTMYHSTKIAVESGDNSLVTLKVTAGEVASSTRPRPPALAAGTAAPEWTIAEWTDGKQRKLSDYRGKVVVLDFWGVWCGPCINTIPAMKKLHEHYQDRDVVFVGIHTAGTDMVQVKGLLKQKEWDALVGLDTGDAIQSGETVRRYAIQGYPTIMIVDRKGVINFNSGDTSRGREAAMREMESVAKSAGIPWPIDGDASEDVAKSRMMQLQFAWLRQLIDKALESKDE